VTIALATVAGVGINFLQIDLVRMLFVANLVNGLVAAPVIGMLLVAASDRKLMGDAVAGGWSRIGTGATALLTGVAAIALLVSLAVH
jgi:Mn2+/Fe2+ NRAMP family transporter